MTNPTHFRTRLPILALALLAGLLLTSAIAAADRIETGERARALALESSEGESFDLQSLTGDKKALLVFFRGTW